ncbi:AraC family transcriptional regulator [Leptospira barantonii]|uniref:AraC family transcriptional regulator n=1 Tax=Leptospira barantonii TaxID=2023184 RepID=A0A5F2AXH0_9LEPT|nr:helix-turn-helix domain-containing protein [Leptospira barantonii]TGL92394.1 AraC family transcriptional regulator [Leptospira barantonii]
MNEKKDKPRGVLKNTNTQINSEHARYLPSERLQSLIEHHWTVRWDLRRKEPYLAQTLPHPSIHIVFEKGQSRIQGIIEGKFSHLLEDEGFVWGIKFKPGAFYPFFQKPIRTLTNRSIPIESVFSVNVSKLEHSILTAKDNDQRIEITESILFERLPEIDANILWIQEVVQLILDQKEILRAEDVAQKVGVNLRTLQRLFSRYVGVTPKWVIQRYRLHEAAERLENGENVDGSGLALDLGYFDQAHFIKDFKSMIGISPEKYSKNLKFKN